MQSPELQDLNQALDILVQEVNSCDREVAESGALQVYLFLEQDGRLKRGTINESMRQFYRDFLPAPLLNAQLSKDQHAWLVDRVLQRLEKGPSSPGLKLALRYANKRLATRRFLAVAVRDASTWGPADLANAASTLYEFFHQRPRGSWAAEAAMILQDFDTQPLLQEYQKSDDENARDYGLGLARSLASYRLGKRST